MQSRSSTATTTKQSSSNVCLSIRCIQLPHDDEQEYFKKQWHIVSKLKHENLCPCIALVSSCSNHNVYYITSCQYKTTLYAEVEYLKKINKRVNEARMYQVCAQVLNGLHVLHMHKIYLGPLFTTNNLYIDKAGNVKIGDYAFFHFHNIIERQRSEYCDTVCAASDFAHVAKILIQYICGTKELVFIPNENGSGQIPEFTQQQLARFQKLDSSLTNLLITCVKFQITDSNQMYEYFEFFDTVSPVRSAYLDFKYMRLPHLKCLEQDQTLHPPNLSKTKQEDISIMKKFVEHEEVFCNFARNYFVIEPNISCIPAISDLAQNENYFPKVHMKQVLIPQNLLPSVEATSDESSMNPTDRIMKTYSNLTTLRGLFKKHEHNNPDFVRMLFPANQENTFNYQKSRVLMFRSLLLNAPTSRPDILKASKENIPPTLRGEIWSVLLECPPFHTMVSEWNRLQVDSKFVERDLVLDRQIEVDIIRCHQYHHIMKTKEAKDAVTAVLQTWVRIFQSGTSYSSEFLTGGVYWQGIDSIGAVFVVLNAVFQAKIQDNGPNLARALFSMDRFVSRNLAGYFVHSGHEGRMQRDLVILAKLVNWIDVEIGGHLELVGFSPELYAIPWLLTCFAHVLPMEKIYLLWDFVMVNNPSVILFIAVAIIRQLKSELLHCDFNTAMTQFQNLQYVDIRKALLEAKTMLEKTPTSFLEMPYITTSTATHLARKEEKITLDEYRSYLTPRLSAQEFAREYVRISVVLDIRPLNAFRESHLRVAASIFHFARDDSSTVMDTSGTENEIESFNEDSFVSKLRYKRGLPVILIDDTDEYTPFCKRLEKLLIMEKVPYVCVVFGGMRAIRRHTNLEILMS
jgi:hypothetical protein